VRDDGVDVANNKQNDDDDDDDEVFLERSGEEGFFGGVGGGGGEESVSACVKAGAWNTVPAAVNLPREALPNHVALIMDGNARWAVERRLPVSMGHERGVDTLRTMVRCCGAWGVPAVTVYAFSQENWNRDREEVDSLMVRTKISTDDSQCGPYNQSDTARE
jgi:hypothetical protein